MQELNGRQAGAVCCEVPSEYRQGCRDLQLCQRRTAGEHTGRALAVICCSVLQIAQVPAIDIHVRQILTIPEHAIRAGDDALIPHTQIDLRQAGILKHREGLFQLTHIPGAQIDLRKVRAILKHAVGIHQITGVPAAAIHRNLRNTGSGEHLVHVCGFAGLPSGHVQRCDCLTATEHTDHLRHALGVPSRHIQALQLCAVHEHAIVTARSTGILDFPGIPVGDIDRLQVSVLREHTARVDHQLRIQDIRAGDLFQGAHAVIGLGHRPHGIRVRKNLSVSVTGDREGLLICAQIHCDLTAVCNAVHSLVGGGIPGCLTGRRRVLIHDIDGFQQIIVDRRGGIPIRIRPVILPGIFFGQHWDGDGVSRPLRRDDHVCLSDSIVHHRHDPCLGILIQCFSLSCTVLAVLNRCAIIGIVFICSIGEGDRLSVDRYHSLPAVIGSQRCARQGTAHNGLDLYLVTAVIRGPVIIQNLSVTCYNLRTQRIYRCVLDITCFALRLVVIVDIKRFAAKLDVRPSRMVEGNGRQLRAVSCEI